MGIYRGAGGTGDAVADSSSEALLIRNLAVEVQADADAAAASAAAAAVSAANALTSENNADTSEANASTSADEAAASAASILGAVDDAEAAQLAAETAASEASDSADAAAASATAAASSASSASTSASTATTQASNASTSATSAASSATSASGSASSASTSATNAASSATAASGSASAASSSASSASTSASNAATSETNAAGSATTATTQAGIATTQATNAASSASAASTSATNAASSATSASGSATTASTAATNASNSATAAATSATNAATSETNAAASAAAAAATVTSKVSKSGDTMTGTLNLPASTSSLIPLNIAEGTTPTSPVDGDIWVEADGLFAHTAGFSNQLDVDSNMSGVLEMPTITITGSGATFNASSVKAFLFSTSTFTGNFRKFTIPAATGLALVDQTSNYLVVTYNSGNPIFSVTQNVADINGSDVAGAAILYRNGTEVHHQSVNWGLAPASRNNRRLIQTRRYERGMGLALGETTGRVITLSSGVIWYGVTEYSEPAVTSASSNAEFWYHVSGVWTKSTVSTYNNTQYDNGTNLVTLSGAGTQYAVNWVYRYLDGAGLPKLAYVLGSGNYNLAQAVASGSPTPPEILSQMAILVGRIIVAQNASTATQIDSAFTQVFAGTTVTDHNDLGNLQGGTTDEYYHLTSAQHTVATQAATSSLNGYLSSTDWSTFNGKSNVTNLDSLSDVAITTPATDQVLKYNGSGWVNGAGNASLMKNRIINGDCRIDQRNAGASVSGTLGNLIDRWAAYTSQANKITAQQNAGSVTPPVGFTNYLGFTSTSAYSSISTDYIFATQKIEGFNVADLGWGTANAKTITVSFQVYSSLTGTFGGAICNGAENRSYPFSYTIPVANTWTTISTTIPGDTTGTWLTNNGIGLMVKFNLGSGSTRLGTAGSWAAASYDGATGSVSVVGTSGATFYITGVQIEVGSSATGFEYVNYQTSLANCQRYCFVPSASSYYIGVANGSNQGLPWVTFPTSMRSAPTATFSGSFTLDNGSSTGTTSTVSLNTSTTDGARTYFTSATGASWSAGQAINISGYSARAMIFSAEL